MYPHFAAYPQNCFQNQGRIGFSCHCGDYEKLTDGVGEGGYRHAGSKVTVSEFDREGLVVLFRDPDIFVLLHYIDRRRINLVCRCFKENRRGVITMLRDIFLPGFL